MHSEPSKIVVTGIIVSVIAIVAFVSQSGTRWLSADDSGPVHGDEPVHRTLGNMVSGVVTPGPVVARRDSGATKAGAPQAARQSPPRNDLVAAQTQLDGHDNDAQARADTGQRAAQAARVEKKPAAQAQPQSTPLRTSPPKAKHSHSHETRVAVHGAPANRAPRNNANDQKALDSLVARLNRNSGHSSHSAPGGKTSVARAPAVANQSSATPAELKGPPSTSGVSAVPPLLPPILSAPQAEPTLPAAAPSPAVQSAPSEDAPVQLDAGPKTRAQVRSEIGRAREEGKLPAFGNPDPAGPAGAPSLTNTPRP